MSNVNKARSGVNTKHAVLQQLKDIKSDPKLSPYLTYEKDFTTGEQGKDPKQFSMDFKLSFPRSNNENWFIKVSSSYRSDRFKGYEFDALNIKKFYKTNKREIFIFVIPDSISNTEMGHLKKLEQDINEHTKVIYFNRAVVTTELNNMIIKKCTEDLATSKASNILGPYAEKAIVDAFKPNSSNILIWNHGLKGVSKSYDYSIFRSILETKLESTNSDNNIKEIINDYGESTDLDSANQSSDLTRKTTGGMPKTDVYIKILLNNSKICDFRISVKFPLNLKGSITVSQGKVNDLLTDLRNTIPVNNPLNTPNKLNKLSRALKDFQRCGNTRNMNQDNKIFIKDNIQYLNTWLIKYFVFGDYNSSMDHVQKANMLTVFNPYNGAVESYTKEHVIRSILSGVRNKKSSLNRPFGATPFNWTYQGKRGASIQVKLNKKLLFD